MDARVEVCKFGAEKNVFEGSDYYDMSLNRLSEGAESGNCFQEHEQTVIVLSGMVDYIINGVHYHLVGGELDKGEISYLTIPANQEYSYKNVGDQECLYMTVTFGK